MNTRLTIRQAGRKCSLLCLTLLLGLVAFNSEPNRFLVAAEDRVEDEEDQQIAADDVVGAINDDTYVDMSAKDFRSVSVMPVSCVDYMNGNMIKFQFFDAMNNFQCHTNSLGTYVASVSHYMRAYFNQQALIYGKDFSLPYDASYLNCVMVQETLYSDQKLWAKIGCLERDSYTSTKLRLHLYTDKQCTVEYDDGQTVAQHRKKGYLVNGNHFSTKVSFRPPFYKCNKCGVSDISESFSKQGTYWYDDDAVAQGKQLSKYDDVYDYDDYFAHDDHYYKIQNYINNKVQNYKEDDDDFYTNDGKRRLIEITPAKEEKEAFEKEFWEEVEESRRLEDKGNNGNQEDIEEVAGWNMCAQVFKYGIWCDSYCRSLDVFHVDEWSSSDLALFIGMTVFIGVMFVLIFAKRVKQYQRETMFEDSTPGTPPMTVALTFCLILITILTLAFMRLVNETLVFTVICCILLFIYMLKLTLFAPKKSGLIINTTTNPIYA